jgi:lipoprotein-releasing system permease protein
VPFEWFVALRYLRDARGQTVLILAAVAIGVSVLVFLSALIGGLQASLIDKTLGSQAHVTLRMPREEATALVEPTPTTAIARLREAAGRSACARSISGRRWWPSSRPPPA